MIKKSWPILAPLLILWSLGFSAQVMADPQSDLPLATAPSNANNDTDTADNNDKGNFNNNQNLEQQDPSNQSFDQTENDDTDISSYSSDED